MAEDIIYEQVGGGEDPDPLGLRKKLAASKTGQADPLGLRAKLPAANPKLVEQPKAFEVKVLQPGSAQPSGLTMEGTVISPATGSVPKTREFSFEKPLDLLGAVKLANKARAAQQTLEKELAENRDVKINMIKQRRFEQASRNVELPKSDMPKVQSEIDVQRIIPQAIKPQDLPVTEEDLIIEDEDVIKDRGKAVRLLEETMKAKPDKAKEIQKNAYLVDAFNSLQESSNPEERAVKIEANAKKIEKGEVVYDPRSGQLVKPVGLVGSALEGWKQKSQLFADYDLLKSGDDATVAAELEKRRTKFDPDEAIPVPKGKLAEAMQMLGGTPIKPILGGVVAGTFGTPMAAAVAGGAIGGLENAKLEYASNFRQVYDELRNQGVGELEAVKEARKQAENAELIGFGVGAVSGAIGAKMGARPFTAAPLSNSFKQTAYSALKSAKSELGKAGLEGMAVGSVSGLGQTLKNALAREIGIDRDLDEGVLEQIEGELLGTVAMAMAIKGGRGLSKLNYKKLLNGLSRLPNDQINGMLQEKVNSGEITQAAADETLQRINEYRGLDKLIPDDVSEEARFKIQDKIQKRNELEQRIESTDKAYHPELKEKIKAIDEEILNLSKEKVKEEKPFSGLTKAQEKDATEFAEELLAEGILPDQFKDQVKQDPIGLWRTIAQQAQNRDTNWKPLNNELEQSSLERAIEDYGETVVEYAKELFPAPEVPESRVSVVLPHEIKQPETITIKPKENAIQERSAESVLQREPGEIGEAGSGRERVEPGEQGAEITGTQRQAKEEGNVEGEAEKVGIHAEQPPTQISFRGLQEVANEFGYEDVRKRERVSDIQERKNAETTVNEWASKGEYQKNIDDLLGRIESREHVPTAKQRLILEQYLANERQKLRDMPKNSAEYDAQLLKVKRIKDIGQIARQEAGAALRLPDQGTLPHPIMDEENAMVAKMEANAVDKLTDEQKAEVEAQVAKYKTASDDANAKVAKLEEQVANADAEKEFKRVKSTTKKTKKTTEERLAYRKAQIEAAREALKKLRTGESGLSAVPLPGVRELMAIAPHVKNIMVDLVAQGVDNLQTVVKQLHNEFKDVLDGITEKHIHDIIAGEYNEPKKSKSALQAELENITYEAKLINQLEALERGLEPKAEKAKRDRNQKIKDLRDKIKDIRKQRATEEKEAGEFYSEEVSDDSKALTAIKKRNEKRAQEIRDKIAKGDFEKETKKSIFDREDVKKNYPNLRKEALDAIAKKEDAQHEFDLALLKDQMARRSKVEKGVDFVGKLIHTSKAVASGIDDSATFIQNGLAMLANPKTGSKVWLNHWKDAFSDKRFKRELAAIHERPDWEIIKKSGLDITEPSSAAGEKAEEIFEQNLLAGKFKIKGKEFQPWKNTGGIFERAFTSMGNNMRLALFEKRMQMLIDEGKTFESHPEEYKAAARVINELTGRGKLPEKVAQSAQWITPFIWAPRMLTATVNTLGLSDLARGIKGKGYYQNLTPAQRKFALQQLGRGVAVGVGVMGAAALAGATVDYDPRSVTFGDVIMGDHHYNVFGRFTPVIKALVQFASGTRMIKGQKQDLDNAKMGGKTRMGIVGGFFRGKLTPAAGAGYDLAEGKHYYTREEFGVKDLPEALIQPMSIKDLREGWKNDGTWSILNRFLPAFEGIKVSDERDFKKKNSGSDTSKSGGRIKRGIKRSSNRKIKHL